MPTLKNQRQELFAQGLAKGKTADDAYAEAGYKPDRGNAARLTANDSIRTRVAELQERGAVKVEKTLADIIRQLDEDRDLARKINQPGAAVSATMGQAKLLGMITDKTDVKAQVVVSSGPDLSNLSEEQLRALAAIPLG